MIVHRDLSKSDSLHQNQTTMLSILFLLVAMQRLGMAMEYRLTSDDLNGRRSYGQGIDFPDGPEWLPAAIKEARQHAACSTGLTSLSTEGYVCALISQGAVSGGPRRWHRARPAVPPGRVWPAWRREHRSAAPGGAGAGNASPRRQERGRAACWPGHGRQPGSALGVSHRRSSRGALRTTRGDRARGKSKLET